MHPCPVLVALACAALLMQQGALATAPGKVEQQMSPDELCERGAPGGGGGGGRGS